MAFTLPEEQVRRIPRDIFNKYFAEDNKPGHFKIIHEIKRSISYQRHDLLTLNPVTKGVGLVLCKDVLLHFNKEDRIRAYKMFHSCLEETLHGNKPLQAPA